MRDLRTAIAACCGLVLATGTAAAEDMAFSVTVKGICQSQVPIAGSDQCQEVAKYTSFKSGKYTFQFTDKSNNVYILSGAKNRQLDATNMYSNIDTIVSTIGGQKTVDSQVMGGCNTKITADGDKFIYIDCTLSNSKRIPLKFRITNITYVQHDFAQ
jgi:hypothetical protein